jgi:ABC-2 type transport system ATP-binding protein
MITLKHVSKSFGPIQAIQDLSLSLKEGNIIGLLGPNGAGKTTTMRMMTGFLSPDVGSVTVNRISLEKNPIVAQKQIGYLPENNPLYHDMTVSEMLAYVGEIRSLTPALYDDGLAFAIRATDIGDVYNRPVSELSKGYKQRVGMAATLLHRPRVLILDEPTEGLDPNQRTEIRGLVKDLAKNHTVVISTHVMQEVEAVCDRVLIINKGSIVADGSLDELRKQSSRTISVTIEGSRVISELKKSSAIASVEKQSTGTKKTTYHITPNRKKHVQPVISSLAGSHGWTIWHMAEQQHNMEDVFHELTQ